jgi:hypothetical protein
MTQIRSASYVVLGDDSTPLMLWDGDTLNFMVAIDVGDSGIVDTTALATVSGDIITQVNQDISDLIGTAPAVLDTLGELSDAIGDDPNFITTVTSGLTVHKSSSDHDGRYYTEGEVNSISGAIVGQIPSLAGYATTIELTTTSGDIVNQIPTDYVSDSEMTTVSGDIVDQIPTDYISDSEMTTISGDIIAAVESSVSGWFDDGTNFRVTFVNGIITNVEATVSGGYSI